jgi:site-specific recombinase XerD
MRRWDSVVDRYMAEYVARGVSPGTVTKVQRELERWGSWLKRRRPRLKLEAIGSDLLIRYISMRTAFRSKSTVQGTMSVMRSLGDFLVREGYWQQNPLRWMQGPKRDARSRVPRRISRERMQRLWQTAATSRGGYHQSLWLAVLAALYGTGLRRGELERLDVDDWDREEGVLLVDGRKTGRPRRIPVPPMLWRCLEGYVVQRHNHLEALNRLDEKALLVNRQGGRLNGTAISQGVHRLARRGGMGRVTLHQFRHSCASDLLEDGVRLPEVQRILGHQTISTTIRYLHIADPQRHAAVRRHPINEMLDEERGHEQARRTDGPAGRGLPVVPGRGGPQGPTDGDRRAVYPGSGDAVDGQVAAGVAAVEAAS